MSLSCLHDACTMHTGLSDGRRRLSNDIGRRCTPQAPILSMRSARLFCMHVVHEARNPMRKQKEVGKELVWKEVHSRFARTVEVSQ